jgi:hypothetical protein
MDGPFRWTTPLGLSVISFLVIGALWIFVGVLSVPLHKKANPEYLFVSTPADTAYYGADPSNLAPPGSALAKLRSMLITVLAGFLTLAGTLVIFIALVPLRQGHSWALVALVTAIVPALVLWGFALLPYVHSGVPLRIGDIPPLMWVPTVLILPATVLGWIGIR